MKRHKKLKNLSSTQMADYIFDDLNKQELKLVESFLMENERAYSTSLELMLLTMEKGLSKVDLLAFLRNAKQLGKDWKSPAKQSLALD